MKVDTMKLMVALQKAPSFFMPEMDQEARYLFEQVYRRLAKNETVMLSELDFSAFEEDSIHTLADMYDDIFERNSQCADGIAHALRRITPASKNATFI